MRLGTLRAARVLLAAVCVSCKNSGGGTGTQQPKRTYGLGAPAAPAEVAARDVDVGPDGAGLPPGHGTPNEGQVIYAQQCASCHGERGEGKPPLYPRLVGRDSIAEGFRFAQDERLPKTIGNYWPFATTVFDYVRRAMPLNAPGSLTNDQVYAVTAYLLSANQIIPAATTLDSARLVAVRMPYLDRFVKDDRRGGREVR
jgi:S-disulfanyl-L-cysteine oxidoreductase SoxD